MKIQKEKLSSFFIDNTLDDLIKIKECIEKIKTCYEELNKNKEDFLSYFIYPSDISKQFENIIELFDKWFNKTKNSDNDFDTEQFNSELQKYYDCLKENYENYFENISKSYQNEYLTKISDLNKQLNNIITFFCKFDPPAENNILDNAIGINSSTEQSALYEQLLDEKNHASRLDNFYSNTNQTSKDQLNESSLKCKFHQDYEVKYCCTDCNMLFCQECNKIISKEINIHNHKLGLIEEFRINNENQKNRFIETFNNFIIEYIKKASYILNNTNIKFYDEKTGETFHYPIVSNELNNPESQRLLLEEINRIYKFIKEKIDINNSISEEINNDILTSLKENLNIKIEDSVGNIDDDFYSDEKAENEDDDKETTKKIFDKIKSQYLYIINLINKEKYNYVNNGLNEDIITKVSEALSIDKSNISILSNSPSIFINYFIKTQLFSKLSLKEIRLNYNLKPLYDYKLLIDGLIRYKCKIPLDKLDFNYNFIIPNLHLNNKRGTEIYNPPYGWYGIGLNVINKYEKEDNSWLNKNDLSSKWAIGYYFFGKKLKSDEIINNLNDIIDRNDLYKDETYNMEMNNTFNKRNKGKLQSIEAGYYLSSDINIAEKYTGIISFNNKRYKVILMAKVLIESIQEPYDGRFWIISKKEDIRVYKILLKEVYY